jgi:plastocyanin/methionine-rich copper-binding protein CopC
MSKKSIILAIIALVIILGIVLIFSNRGPANPEIKPDIQRESIINEPPATDNIANIQFENAKKSAHYETNTPAHGAILAAAPVNIVIDFNFDLAPPSSISITKDGTEYGQGDTMIDSNKLTMRRSFSSNAPDGKYVVSYKACWPDRSCHDGSFEFAIDRDQTSRYENMQGKAEVTIRMSEIMFAPKNIVISKGTKVTWVNDEAVEHYVNTDSHPAHTYYPQQNSRSLAQGQTYSATFNAPGAYPYHCSAHADTMVGNIVVI